MVAEHAFPTWDWAARRTITVHCGHKAVHLGGHAGRVYIQPAIAGVGPIGPWTIISEPGDTVVKLPTQVLLAFVVLAGLSRVAGSAPPPNIVSSDSSGSTAMGSQAVSMQTTGTVNTGAGAAALHNTTSGRANTAVGAYALEDNTTGSRNTAIGQNSLNKSKTGNDLAAFGFEALRANTTGIDNTALGASALSANTTGVWNTATGSRALKSNTVGKDNTAAGFAVLDSNTTGEANTATGSRAMFFNTGGNLNTATGYSALYNNATGARNVALGYQAGFGTTGSDNIVIGANNMGAATENGVTRIGDKAFQKKAFVAGISGVKTGLAAAKTVFIDANGQLGTVKSSRVYKEDIRPMGSVSDRLLALRPVTFRYKEAYDDGSKPLEFGLIAEEVAEVFPELVVNDADGKPETVRYDLVATLLLNEFEKERTRVQTQADRIEVLERQAVELAQLKVEFARMAETVSRLDRTGMVASR